MSTENSLHSRSGSQCELCSATKNLNPYDVPPHDDGRDEHCVLLCETCLAQVNATQELTLNHWRCLNDSMWNPTPAVQVTAWRMLSRLAQSESWAGDLLETLYLDEETLAWAQTGNEAHGSDITHKDSNGVTLSAGDTVTLIKDLNVKGTSFTAKRGTAVRKISLVPNNAEHIEGRVNGQQIVILTQFVKKTG